VGLILLVVAFLIIGYAIVAIVMGRLDEPDALAVWVSILSIIGNEAMARHSICAAGQINSSAMLANGLENRADVYSSVAALFGVLGAKMGYVWLDPLAAAVVGGLILRSAYVISREGIEGLIDKTNVGGSGMEQIVELIKKNREVASINHIRSRRSGQKVIFDIGLAVAPSLTLAQVRPLKERLKREIFSKLENVECVNIRFSPIKEH
jgi:cation diffusion facilitator family transporter